MSSDFPPAPAEVGRRPVSWTSTPDLRILVCLVKYDSGWVSLEHLLPLRYPFQRGPHSTERSPEPAPMNPIHSNEPCTLPPPLLCFQQRARTGTFHAARKERWLVERLAHLAETRRHSVEREDGMVQVQRHHLLDRFTRHKY